jgi:AcrR family transcriptional regulator
MSPSVNACTLEIMADTSTHIPRSEQRRRTEARILAAARHLFSEVGYERATIRAIAAAAETNIGLVTRHFGSKENLFNAAAQAPADEPATGSPEQIGEHLLASLTAKMETTPEAALALLRSMLTHPEATAGVRESIALQQRQLSATLALPDASLRIAAYGAISLGLIVGRYLLELDSLTDATPQQITELMRPVIRALTTNTSTPAKQQ